MTADDNRDQLKIAAAKRAAELLEPGMRLGLGTGSTAKHFVDCVGERVATGLRIRCVTTSERTEAQAKNLGFAVTTLIDAS